MGSYKSTITTFTDGVVTVSSNLGTSYNTILNSQSGHVYGVIETYINTSLNQLFQPYQYSRYDVNGNIEAYYENTVVDPYQYINAIFFKPLKDNVYLDGRTNFSFTILPNETVNIVIQVEEIAISDMITPTKFFNDDFFNILNDYNREI